MTKETNPEMEVESKNLPASNQEIVNDQPEIEGGDEGEKPELELELESEEESQEEEEFEEAEYEGKKYKLPKELKHALLRQSDYTKKTQEVAEARKTLDNDRQAIQKIRAAQEEEFKGYAEVYNLDLQLAEYSKINWDELIEQDPKTAMKLEREFKTLHERRIQRLQEIHKNESERSLKQQQESAKREEETRTKLSREIKNWGTELEGKLTDYAKSQGIPEETIKGAIKYDATAVKILHKAHLYDQLLKKATQKPKAPEASAPVKSIPMKSSKVISSEPSDKDSMDEWLRKRNAQLRAKNQH